LPSISAGADRYTQNSSLENKQTKKIPYHGLKCHKNDPSLPPYAVTTFPVANFCNTTSVVIQLWPCYTVKAAQLCNTVYTWAWEAKCLQLLVPLGNENALGEFRP